MSNKFWYTEQWSGNPHKHKYLNPVRLNEGSEMPFESYGGKTVRQTIGLNKDYLVGLYRSGLVDFPDGLKVELGILVPLKKD